MANCLVARRQLELVEFDENAFLGADAERHLDECADCRAFASDMRALRGMLADQPRVAVPPHFETSLKARIRREAPRYREPRLAWIPTPALGVIALATVISVGFVVRSNFALMEPANVASTSNTVISAPVTAAQKVETATVRPIAATPVAMTARPIAVKPTRATHRQPDLEGLSAHLPSNREVIPAAASVTATPFYVENPRREGQVVAVPKTIYGATPAFSRGEASQDESF